MCRRTARARVLKVQWSRAAIRRSAPQSQWIAVPGAHSDTADVGQVLKGLRFPGPWVLRSLRVMGWVVGVLGEAAARRELLRLWRRLNDGVDTSTGVGVGLLALIDQHAAAVRDILALSVDRVGPVELAAYARGVHDGATEFGWRLADDGLVAADWVRLRLVAACRLALAPRRVTYGQ